MVQLVSLGWPYLCLVESIRETPRPWRFAWHDALYAERGFYTAGPGSVASDDPDQPSGPARHFRTSVAVGQGLAAVVSHIVAETRIRLRDLDTIDIIDVGAGDGALLHHLMTAIEDSYPDVMERCRFTGVDVHVRPSALDARITWVRGLAPDAMQLHMTLPINGVVIAHEWLDNIPCDVIEIGRESQPCVVLVDHDGNETLGPSLWDDTACNTLGVDAHMSVKWLERWWPSAVPGTFMETSLYDSEAGARAEIGISRDEAISAVAKMINRGTLLVIDYAHDLGRRTSGAWTFGSLAGYRNGRMVDPVPNGNCDITAHVALDSCGAAVLEGLAAQGKSVSATIQSQRDVMERYGLSTTLPPQALATSDPRAYAQALALASDVRELMDPASLGNFQWLRVEINL